MLLAAARALSAEAAGVLPAVLPAHDRSSVPAQGALPPFTASRLLTGWELELLPALVVAVLAAAYVAGVLRLRRRGASWPLGRSVAFLAGGLGSAVVATQSALSDYDTTLLWVHMVQHMVLSMVVPIFLALGAPVTLALRTLPGRPRRGLLALLHSRYARVVSFPVVSGALFVATPFAVYFTGWHEATLRAPLLHDLNHLHFVAVGCLWFWPILGLDPLPGRLPYLFRLLAVLVTLPFHAFLGIAVMSGTTLLAGDWYASLQRSWGPSLAQDQQIAGGVLWGAGDLVGLVIAGVLLTQWFAEAQREGVREDRRLDRLERQAALAAAARPGIGGGRAEGH
jgi:cytochrome c oxidase assembly factor CtaG